MMKKEGMVYVFTGDGKGKTSAALGVAVRAICAGLKVAWIAWYKEASWPISEKKLPELLPIDFYLMGKGFHISNEKILIKNEKMKKTAPLRSGGQVVDHASEREHKEAAELVTGQKYDVVICDEINNALSEGLISLEAVLKLINCRARTHLVLTGRNAPQEIVEKAELVSEVKKIKHPYDQGIAAVKGLDF
jgi:cob(I)alamin adenosyltransferase